MQAYDFIFAGGGVAGLSLAYLLARSPLRDRSMLIVDRDTKDQDDRTLGFWTDRPTPFDDVVCRSWSQLQFVCENTLVVDLGTWRYKVIRGIDFYRYVRQELSAYPNIEYLQGTVGRIEDGQEQAIVPVDAQTYAARWVFDSRFDPTKLVPKPRRYHTLQWHFRGWVIETPEAVFDPQIATPFDFWAPLKGGMQFYYVLPFSEHRALVEYVLLSPGEYDRALRAYLETILGIQDYTILSTEEDTLPMTDRPFPRKAGRRIIAIGILGGRIKPSSGYAFTRIQQDSASIVRSLLQNGHPFDVPPDPRRYQFYDSLLLQVMYRHGEQIKPIFDALIANNPIDRVFRFLDERASLWEDLSLMASVPSWPFLRALFRLAVLRRV